MKNFTIIALLLAIGVLAMGTVAASGQGNPVVRRDAALDEIVPPGVTIEKVAGGLVHLEGPVWVRQRGYLLFSDLDTNVIHKWSPADGRVTVFLENSGFATPEALERARGQAGGPAEAAVVGGSNGITVDPQGRIVYCARGDRQVMRLEEDGRRSVVASQFEGKPLNRPNDLVYKSDGSLYFTDPNDTGDGGNVYVLRNGNLRRLAQNLPHPNGLAFSPDEKHLYIVDSRESRKIHRFDVRDDGSIANGRILFDMSGEETPGGPDGMKVDQKGNVYAPGPGGVWIISPDGKHLGSLRFPERIANMAFGDADGKTLYLTGRTSVYRVRLMIPGIRP
jgi:gluconolactonase